METQKSFSNVISPLLLPHQREDSVIELNISINDDSKININIEVLENKYLEKKKMKLFNAPLRTTPSVLVNMNIKDYVVSSKPDGIFSALYIDSGGTGYYLYPLTRRLYKIGKMTNPLYYNTICNGELMEKDTFGDKIQPYLLLFDILEWKKKKLTNNLFKRIDICKKIIKYFKIDKKCKLKYISVKSYVPLKSIYRIISSKHPRKDGVIFTLKNGKPGTNCIRWKPLPTITVGLDFDKKENDFRIYFSDTNNRNKFRKRYYDIYNRYYTVHKSFSSFLFRDILNGSNIFDMVHSEHFKGKQPIGDYMIELFVDKDPFNKGGKGQFEIMRFRDDKQYPDHIDIVNDILNLMFNPIRLDQILGKKSTYSYWIPPSKNSNSWMKYSKSIKKIIYERWSNSGALLDMCAGRGSDTMLLYTLSKKKKFTSIHCLENDIMQKDALSDFTTMIRHDNLIGMDCKINIKQGDMNDPLLPSYYQKQFDTIICSNAIQFAMDPYETQRGLDNIKKLLKVGGTLIIIFMNGDNLAKSAKVCCQENNCTGYDCANHSNEESDDKIVDAGSNMDYYYTDCNCYSSSFNPLDIYKSSVGLFYTYEKSELRKDNTYYDKSHIWVKIPTSFNAVREPIVRSSSLVFQLRNLGFRLIETNDFKSIKDEKHELASLYSYAIFENKSYKTCTMSFFMICEDVFFHILGYLNVVDIFSLGKVHRTFTDKCLKHMKLQPLEWGRLYTEIANNECEEISYWT